jgi:hypothetical protein
MIVQPNPGDLHVPQIIGKYESRIADSCRNSYRQIDVVDRGQFRALSRPLELGPSIKGWRVEDIRALTINPTTGEANVHTHAVRRCR